MVCKSTTLHKMKSKVHSRQLELIKDMDLDFVQKTTVKYFDKG